VDHGKITANNIPKNDPLIGKRKILHPNLDIKKTRNHLTLGANNISSVELAKSDNSVFKDRSQTENSPDNKSPHAAKEVKIKFEESPPRTKAHDSSEKG